MCAAKISVDIPRATATTNKTTIKKGSSNKKFKADLGNQAKYYGVVGKQSIDVFSGAVC